MKYKRKTFFSLNKKSLKNLNFFVDFYKTKNIKKKNFFSVYIWFSILLKANIQLYKLNYLFNCISMYTGKERKRKKKT